MLARFFDKVITLAGVYLLVLIWAGYFLPREDRLLVSFVIAVIITGLIFLILRRRKKADGRLSKKQTEHMEEVMGQFAFSDLESNIRFFAEALDQVYAVTPCKNYFVVTHRQQATNDDISAIADNPAERVTIVFPFMRLIKLTMADLSEMYAEVSGVFPRAPLLILTLEGATKSAEDTAAALAERKVTILSKSEVYQMLGELNSYPPITVIIKKSNKRKIGEIAAGALSPKMARRYLIIAAFMLITSFFVPMSIYYVIFASFVTVLALACKLNIAGLLSRTKK